MFYILFFSLNQLVFGNLQAKEEKSNLIIDFGGKFIKGGVDNMSSNSFSYLSEKGNEFCGLSTDCYSIPNSISAAVDDLMRVNKSEEAVKVGNEAFAKAAKNHLLGIQYYGAIFNRKRSFVSSNCDFFNIDFNVTISDFKLYWYLIQFFSKYHEKTSADEITIILPGYTTDKTREEMETANNNSFNKITVFKDYDIIQKVHSYLFNKDQSKNVLYLDFGAFSTKATVISKESEIVSYEFNEELGIEKVAFRQSLKDNEGKQANRHMYDNYVLNTRKEAYEAISSDSFHDEIFEKKLNDIIENSIANSKLNTNSNFEIDEIILAGGGCELPFVVKTVEKLSKGKKFELIEKVENNNEKINHLTFLVDGCRLPPVNNSKSLFVYHPLFIEYNNDTHRIPGISSVNKKPFDDHYQFKINLGKIQPNTKPNQTCIWNGSINVVTDSQHVVGGMSTVFLKLNISNLNSNSEFENKFIQLTGSFVDAEKSGNSIGLKFYAELCSAGENNELECSEKFDVVNSDFAVQKSFRAKKKAGETEAAMALIRVLFDSVSKVKKAGNKEEL